MPMGRKPTVNNNLPPHMRARVQRSGRTFYYYDTGAKPRVEIPLGSDYILAVQKWSEYEQQNIPATSKLTIRKLWELFKESEQFLELSAVTQSDYIKCIKKILEFFDNPPVPLDDIEPVHIRQFHTWRGKTAKTRANREKTLISTLWNYARSRGYTSLPNPCQGIKGFKENSRDVYVEDDVYAAVYEFSDQPTRDAIDLGYLIAQRPGDVIDLSETDIQNGVISIQQSKTSAKLRIEVIGELERTIKRILQRKQQYKVRSLRLIVDEYGKPLSQHAIYKRFLKARNQAAIKYPHMKEAIDKYQIRDLRAKGGTDVAEQSDMRTAQKLLGHSTVVMTEIYVREKRGQTVKPTK